MGHHLRLLYCDSAGVRRCRVVVVPAGHASADVAPADAASQLARVGSGKVAAGLEPTPSMMLAAGAGAVPPLTPASSVTSQRGGIASSASYSNLKSVGEDRVLSPEVPDQPQLQQPLQPLPQQQSLPQQQQQQQQQQPDALRSTPSMVWAAQIGVVPGEAAGFGQWTEGSRDSSPTRSTSSSHSDLVQLQRHAQMAAASAAAASAVGGGSASALHLSPSMVWAAGAGVVGTLSGGLDATSNGPTPVVGNSPAASPLLMARMSPGPVSRTGSAARLLMPALRRPCSASISGARLRRDMSPFAASAAASAVALSHAAEFSVGLTKACMGHPCFGDVLAKGCGLAPVGEVLLVPDLTAVVPVPWCPGSSMAPADMMEKDLSQPWACCPRSALKRALTRLEAQHGVTVLVGFEIEFLLLKPTSEQVTQAGATLHHAGQAWLPWDSSVYDQSSSIDSAMPVMGDMVSTLETLGIGVLQYHAESAPGQFEVALEPFPALEAADKLLFAREALSAVARRHGLAVSFLANALPGAAGSGCHMHFSLQRGGSNVMAAAAVGEAAAADLPPACYALSSTADKFLSGILSHLPALLPFVLPSVNSYERLQPCCWSGAYVCWGYENREAPLRVCCPRGGISSVNAEFKSFDGSTNPHIGLAAVLVAGMQGLDDGSSLPPPLHCDPGADASAAKSLTQLPSSLTSAVQALEQDVKLSAALQDVLGRELVTAYLAVRRAEAERNPGVNELLFRY